MVDITLNNISAGEIQTAIARVVNFASQWPNRVGSNYCCIYGSIDPTHQTMRVHRTPKGRLVVTGYPSKVTK